MSPPSDLIQARLDYQAARTDLFSSSSHHVWPFIWSVKPLRLYLRPETDCRLPPSATMTPLTMSSNAEEEEVDSSDASSFITLPSSIRSALYKYENGRRHQALNEEYKSVVPPSPPQPGTALDKSEESEASSPRFASPAAPADGRATNNTLASNSSWLAYSR